MARNLLACCRSLWSGTAPHVSTFTCHHSMWPDLPFFLYATSDRNWRCGGLGMRLQLLYAYLRDLEALPICFVPNSCKCNIHLLKLSKAFLVIFSILEQWMFAYRQPWLQSGRDKVYIRVATQRMGYAVATQRMGCTCLHVFIIRLHNMYARVFALSKLKRWKLPQIPENCQLEILKNKKWILPNHPSLSFFKGLDPNAKMSSLCYICLYMYEDSHTLLSAYNELHVRYACNCACMCFN